MTLDGGWGWAIAIAKFVIHVIIDGVKYSFGIMFIELVDTFQQDKSNTTWVMSIQIGLMCLSGPIIASLVNRIGCRSSVVIGSIASASAFIASAFVSSVYELYFTFGILAGYFRLLLYINFIFSYDEFHHLTSIGFGMMDLPSRVMLIKYFKNRLAFATGLANMGTGVGALIFNPLSKALIDTYTWRGTLIVEAGIILNGIVCALVFQQPNYFPEKNNCKESDKTIKETLIKEQQNSKPNVATVVIVEHSDEDCGNMIQNEILQHQYLHDSMEKQVIQKEVVRSCADNKYCNVCNKNNIENIQFTKCQDDCDKNHILISSQENIAEMKRKKSWKTLINFMPLKNLGFITFLFGNFLIDLSLNIPITFIPDMMYHKGIAIQDAVWTIFIIGVVSTVSRLGVGVIANLPIINRVKLCNSLVALSGCLVIVGPFCSSFPTFVTFAVFYGLLSGSSNSLRGVLIPDLFGSETIADHLGIVMCTSGLAALVSLPISGAIYDFTGSYRLPFIIAGMELVASGTLMFLIPTIQHYHSRSVL